MLEYSPEQYSKPTTTADSIKDGRMKVSVSQIKGKKAIIKRHLKRKM